MFRKTFLALTLGALVLTGCGSDDDGDDGAAAASELEEPTSGPIEVTDTAGGTAVLDAPAQRVVALEWDYAEELLAMGITPVGVADAAGYGDWLASELPDDVTDVGTRQEPSLERITALDPDLIVGVSYRHETIRDELEQIAPTLLFAGYPAAGEGTELGDMRRSTLTLGEATGHGDEAEEAIADLDAHLEEAAGILEEAGKGGAAVAVAQGFTVEGSPQVRMFTDDARTIELLEATGLTNGWTGPEEQYGFNTVDLEGLTALGEVEFLYIAQDDDDVFADVFPKNPIWASLPFVKADQVHALGGDTWTWGGPQSAKVFVDRVVAALTE